MIDVTGQSPYCDMPVRFDTYQGCTHRCAYCFATRKELQRNKKVQNIYSEQTLLNYVNGNRTKTTRWIDWKMPLHWGGMSDPFQPVEKHYRSSLKALKILAETKYPFVVSTKGELVADPEYLELFSKCNCVIQISMLCSKYDDIEPGAPSFERRLEMLSAVSKVAKRAIVRCQPYTREAKAYILENIPRFKEAGAYGVIFEGMKFIKSKETLEKLGGDFVYPYDELKADFLELKAKCHEHGLKFFSGENRLRSLGDSLCCCGCEGVDGFFANNFNLNHLMHPKSMTPEGIRETPAMSSKGSGYSALKHVNQSAGMNVYIDISFKEFMLLEYKKKRDYYKKVLGIDKL